MPGDLVDSGGTAPTVTCPGWEPPIDALCLQGLPLGAGSEVGRAVLGAPSRQEDEAPESSPRKLPFSAESRE